MPQWGGNEIKGVKDNNLMDVNRLLFPGRGVYVCVCGGGGGGGN